MFVALTLFMSEIVCPNPKCGKKNVRYRSSPKYKGKEYLCCCCGEEWAKPGGIAVGGIPIP
jgi:hypothetical protein